MVAKRRQWLLILATVLLVATGLRVWGCFGQGHPYSFYPDEEGNVKRALRFGQTRTLNPGWFSKPALGYYVIFAEYGAYYLVGRATGRFSGVQDFALHYLDDQGPFYLIGRISTSLFGVLTLLLVYRLGRRFQGRSLGLLSMLALAFCAGHVATGQQVKMDVPAAFWSTFSILGLLGVLRQGRRRDYFWAGFFAGLSTATKYYGMALLVPLLYAHLFRYRKARRLSPRVLASPRLAGGVLSLVFGFFVGSPYNFLDSRWFEHRVLPMIRFLGRRLGLGQTVDVPGKTALVDPSRTSVWDSLQALTDVFFSAPCAGWLLGGLACVGLVKLLVRRSRRGGLLVVITVTLVAGLSVANAQTTHVRHLVVILPVAMILAAIGFQTLWGVVGRLVPAWWRTPGGQAAALSVAIALPLAGLPLRQAVETNLANVAEDGRLQAIRWIEKNVPWNAVIIDDHEVIPLRPNRARCDWVQERLDRLMERGQLEADAAHASLPAQWRMLRELAKRGDRPVYDLIVLDHPWQTEKLLRRPGATFGGSPLWMKSPWGGLIYRVIKAFDEVPEQPDEALWSQLMTRLNEKQRGLAPVELWTHPTRVSKSWLTRDPEKRGSAAYRTVEWVVTLRRRFQTFDPERNPWKRANFPDYTLFYEDLLAHYDRYELNGDAADEGAVIWVFDLRRRIEDREPRLTRVSPGR